MWHASGMILLDDPVWPAHGTRFAHLVSDSNLWELHAFASGLGVPARAFDHDHYDIPESLVGRAEILGAERRPARELVTALAAAGLRVRRPEKTPSVAVAVAGVREAWPLDGADGLRDELIAAWREPHRRYHDVRHLWTMLGALRGLAETVPREVVLAAWFHDAVYRGVPGQDEEESAQWALRALVEAGMPRGEASEVARLVRVTADHAPEEGDESGALVSDADLAVLGGAPGRYHVYLRDVREEYARVPDKAFRVGRLAVVEALLAQSSLFRTPEGRARWAHRAASNLTDERTHPLSWLSSPRASEQGTYRLGLTRREGRAPYRSQPS